jgi:3-isopropylmalate/(R)-2-methylmalate dehydratase small subunit
MNRDGRVWVFGDDVDTDVLAPGQYMKGTLDDLSAHCLEAVNPDFAPNASAGDVVIAGRNFGIGSSREQAAEALQNLGIAAVIAQSFGGIFYRNALNVGLPVFVFKNAINARDGEKISMDVNAAELLFLDRNEKITCEQLPDFLLAMLHDGGLVPHLEKKLKSKVAQK